MEFPAGEVASLAAALCWAIGLTLFRRDVAGIGARAVNLFKGMWGSTLFLLVLAVRGAPPIAPDAQLYLALSGLVGLALGDTLLFVALAHIGAHRTALVATLGPVFTSLGAWALLGESLTAWQVAGIGLATGGVALVVLARVPGGAPPGATGKGLAFGTAAALCQAGGVLLAKRGLAGADDLSATALRLVAATAALAVLALARGDLGGSLRKLLRPGPFRRLGAAATIGTFAGLWLMLAGIARTRSGIASALHSTTPLFTLPIAVFVLKERFGPLAVAGSVTAVGGIGILLF